MSLAVSPKYFTFTVQISSKCLQLYDGNLSMCSCSYHPNLIGNINHKRLFRVTSCNNSMRCIPRYIIGAPNYQVGLSCKFYLQVLLLGILLIGR